MALERVLERQKAWERHPLKDHPMIKACFGIPTAHTPVWFMRQAGSYIPRHKALMDKYDLLTLTRTPELCTEVTLLPIDVLGVDAAVMFADIILPLAGMGIRFHYNERGPVIENPVQGSAHVDALTVADPEQTVPFILQAIRMVKAELGTKAPLIGFSGGPFTLVGYMVEGAPSDSFPRTKALMYQNEPAWHQLMQKLTASIISYLQAQVAAGIDVIQLFDSWIGVLPPPVYERFVLPYTQQIMEALAPTGLPRIHFSVESAGMLGQLQKTGAEVISVDWRIAIDDAWDALGEDFALQGNLDPAILLADFDAVAAQSVDILRRVQGRPGHIFNLGHRVPLNAPVEMLARLVDLVHEKSAQA